MKKKEQIVYQLVVEDIQTVAMDLWDRKLRKKELDIIKSKIADYVHWYDAIWNCLVLELKSVD